MDKTGKRESMDDGEGRRMGDNGANLQ